MVPNTAFDVGMLDLTHPRTANWFKQILQEMVEEGVRGWMADFGEGLPVDACLYSGPPPMKNTQIKRDKKYQCTVSVLFRLIAEIMKVKSMNIMFGSHNRCKSGISCTMRQRPLLLLQHLCP